MFKSSLASPAMAAALCVGVFGSAFAEDRSFTGTLKNDAATAGIGFTVGAPSDIIIRTWSYAGGVNVDSQVIAAGGFDPILTLFDSTGAFIAFSDVGTPDQVGADPLTGARDDAYIDISLASGDYVVVISQYDNFLDPSDPKTINFTGALFGCSQGFFCDTLHNNRTGDWALDIKGVKGKPTDPDPNPSPVPLPPAALLLGSAILGSGFVRGVSRTR